VLHTKLSRTSRELKLWSKGKIRWTKFVSSVVDEVIFNLDVAQKQRELTTKEIELCSLLKSKFLGIMAIARRRKNHIYRLKHNNGWVTEHEAMEEIVFNHFQAVMGAAQPCMHDFNWSGIHELIIRIW
jgi:hypothetical protein